MWLAASSAYLGVLRDLLVHQGSPGPRRSSLLPVEPHEPIFHGMALLHDRPHGNAPSDSPRRVSKIASFSPQIASNTSVIHMPTDLVNKGAHCGSVTPFLFILMLVQEFEVGEKDYDSKEYHEPVLLAVTHHHRLQLRQSASLPGLHKVHQDAVHLGIQHWRNRYTSV